MIATLMVVITLVSYLIIQHKKIAERKKGQKWILYGFTSLTIGASLLFYLPYSLGGVTGYINRVVGTFTKMVIG